MTTTNNEFDNLEPVGTFTIPEWRMDEFKSRFAKLQKKARKLGVAEPTFTVIKEFTKSYTFHPIRKMLF